LITWAGPMGADNQVVVDADRHRLCVAKAVCGRMATGAGVVVVQAADKVKPEQAAEVGPLQFIFAGKAHPADDGAEYLIQNVVRAGEVLKDRIPLVYIADHDMALGKLLKRRLRDELGGRT